MRSEGWQILVSEVSKTILSDPLTITDVDRSGDSSAVVQFSDGTIGHCTADELATEAGACIFSTTE
jgi:hypothetical protein